MSRRSHAVLQALAWTLLIAIGAFPASAKCLHQSYNLKMPGTASNPAAAQGGQLLGSVKTRYGVIEARTVAGGDVDFSLDGKPFKSVSPDRMPPHSLECLKKARHKAGADTAPMLDRLNPFALLAAPAHAEYYKVGGGCKGKGGIKFTVVEVYDEGGGPVYVLEMTQNGRTCGYAVV